MTYFQKVTLFAMGMSLSASASAVDDYCLRARETLAQAEQGFSLALQKGDLASTIATAVFEGAPPLKDEIQNLEALNSEFAQAATDAVEKLDQLQGVISESSASGDSAARVGTQAANLVVGDLIMGIKPKLMRFLFGGMATIECPMPWEDGYADCAAEKLVRYYVSRERVVQGARVSIRPGMTQEEIRRALLGENDEEGELVRIEHYLSVKARIQRGLPAISETVERVVCSGADR